MKLPLTSPEQGRIQRLIRLLERWHILTVDEPWVPPDHKYWYYHCWFPPKGKDKGGYV